MIAIIDYDMGNVGSIANMIKKVGGDSIITRDKATIEAAEKLILPGVGAFDTGMQNIEKFGLLELLNWKVQEKKTPILGVCLGMQLLTESSEEGKLPGLSWIKAKTIKFPSDMTQNERRLTVPHMGWNDARIKKTDKLFQNVTETPRFYFVHSYYVKCDNESDILCETDYGITFTSALSRDNIWGMQFHPEKSHKFGMRLYQCFVNT